MAKIITQGREISLFNALAVANQFNKDPQEIGTQKAAKQSLQSIVPTAPLFLRKARTAFSSTERSQVPYSVPSRNDKLYSMVYVSTFE